MELVRFPVQCETSLSHIVVPCCPSVQSHQIETQALHNGNATSCGLVWGSFSQAQCGVNDCNLIGKFFLDYLFVYVFVTLFLTFEV